MIAGPDLPPPTVVAVSAAERATLQVRLWIADGALPPGARLPEERMCERLGVSRNTLREALAQLVSERILVREPRRGLEVAKPGPAEIREIYRARRLIEPAALREGEAFGPVAVARLRDAVEAGRLAEKAEAWRDVVAANQAFHAAVVSLAGSRHLDQQMALLLAQMRLVFHQRADRSGVAAFHRPYLERNGDICALAEAGDRAAAARELRAYLTDAEAELLGPAAS